MSRRALRRDESAVSLFPFLAVLICTMGALIVLLVVVVQRASAPSPDPASDAARDAGQLANQRPQPPKVESDEPVIPKPADEIAPEGPSLAELDAELAEMRQQAEQLDATRGKVATRLKDQQMTLSRVEDQARQLAEQFEAICGEAKRIALASEPDAAAETQIQSQIERLHEEIARTTSELQRAREEAATNRQLYAIVPYEGPNGTERRPIYVECLADRIVLQPEGVELLASDFEAGMGPHNALAASLRAIREHHLNTKVSNSAVDAYPLLIVRPQGARAYAACRRALTGWDDEFGYELVPNDMQLTYPDPDPALSMILQQIVEQSRLEAGFQVARQPRNSAGLLLSADSRSGGFVAQDGTTAGHYGGGGTDSGQGNDRDHASAAVGKSGQTGQGGSTIWNGAASGSRGQGTLDGIVPPPTSNGGHGTSGLPSMPAYAGSPSTDTWQAGQSGRGGPNPVATGVNASGDGNGARESNQAAPSASPSGTDSIYGGSQGGKSGGGDTTNSGKAAMGGVGTAAANGRNGAPGASGATANMGPQQATPGFAAGGQPPSSASAAFGGGDNWGLPNATNGAIGITRPVYISCTQQGLVLRPVAGAPITVAFEGSTQSAIQPFVTLLWDHIKTWGIAGNGVYWKPVLKVDVKQGGETRFAEFVSLLQDSGLEVIRR